MIKHILQSFFLADVLSFFYQSICDKITYAFRNIHYTPRLSQHSYWSLLFGFYICMLSFLPWGILRGNRKTVIFYIRKVYKLHILSVFSFSICMFLTLIPLWWCLIKGREILGFVSKTRGKVFNDPIIHHWI